MPMKKLARHGIEMQENKHHYTICKERKLVKRTKKLEEEEEGACIDWHWSIIELLLSLSTFWTNKEKKIT